MTGSPRQMRWNLYRTLIAVLLLSTIPSSCVKAPVDAPVDPPARGWRDLEAGLAFGEFPSPRPAPSGDSIVRVLRIDPRYFDLRLITASSLDAGHRETAKEWSRRAGLVAAINPSMYQKDYRRSVSLMRTRSHVNNRRVSKDRAVLAFDRLDDSVPPVQIIDRDCQDFDELRQHYGSLVQSIRMISCDGRNVWKQGRKRWSTAAIGMDQKGRVLFIHVRSPYSTHDLIDILLELPLDIKNAMYTEGGPEAQLYFRSGNEEMQLAGSSGAGLRGNDDDVNAWPVPNILGIVRGASPEE